MCLWIYHYFYSDGAFKCIPFTFFVDCYSPLSVDKIKEEIRLNVSFVIEIVFTIGKLKVNLKIEVNRTCQRYSYVMFLAKR